ncbi:MAG: ATP-dependent zinc metalloprotease FtsH [Bacilli bacterium]|mgnify:CR=1 FL=1|nr:ATP-dependent zinc metalloprotease FtsH [Bacilli bacterium]MDD4607584.1 ATP-dependent zinc metalloprotease FtsH [Bacilli bacterium]
MNKKVVKRGLLPYLVLFLFIVGILYFMNNLNQKVNVLTYDEFIKVANAGEVSEVTIIPRSRASVYELRGVLEGYKENETFFLRLPLAEETMTVMMDLQQEHEFKFEAVSDPESGTFLLFIVNVLPLIMLIGVAFFFLSRQMGGASKSMDFGKSRAKLNDQSKKVTFNEVAGLEEEKEEVSELIDFLKNPKKFQRLGARIPKGVLLVGPPGTGKTLLARAVAGEANVPFFYISGSEFVELFVGVGASRVRDMFKQAKQNAPCLIFIDEIDAVGRQRGAGLGGGHDEREQTLNQLLTEMDGFGSNEGIIIIAATNRPDVLDPALLRPGRFDRQVTVNLPDVKGREEILAVHAIGKTFSKGVKLANVARRTVGFSGADLENLLNEASLLAVRRDKDFITMAEIDEAHDRVLMGPAKKSKKYSEEEKKLVAYHEAGHVVLGLKLDGANDVQKVTIIPRGYAGGYTMMLPKEEKITATKNELLERISGLLGGRVAEELVFDEITTGAHNDFEQATKIARAMVTEYGMSQLGPVQYEHQESSVFLGRDYNKSRNFSSQVAYEIDNEIRKIISEQYEVTTKTLSENRDLLDLIANALIEHETITKEQIDYLVEHKVMPDEDGEKDHSGFEEVSLEDLTLVELKEIAKEKNIKGYSKMKKEELIKELNDK